jgi:hypothetical protein
MDQAVLQMEVDALFDGDGQRGQRYLKMIKEIRHSEHFESKSA